ncbi:polycomb protein SUZ12 [Chrysoperla carnea]|uniref:polycomb protein SUZ12 n=1 Tax=Chrysoperla carnea TaxID=189513 RepID=UPI001D08D260|nr:polycomb protein SUZ12 [Chrysoperla carnea]
MPPKKRDKDAESAKTPKMDHIQADHELFLQAFEKPTQIYRFLRTRNMLSPIFLNRNLSYMKHRMSRTNAARKTFRIDGLLEKITAQKINKPIPNGGQMELIFIGFYDKTIDNSVQYAQVETLLLKICHKKRKDSASPLMQISLGTNEIDVNPSEEIIVPAKQTANVCIPNESFSLSNGHLVKSYMLLLRVHCFTTTSQSILDPDGQPAQKRRKSTSTKIYGAELVIYDKQNRCLLTDGDYEIALQEVTTPAPKVSPKKYSSWETLSTDMDDSCGSFESFKKGPSLKLRLRWSRPQPVAVKVEKVSSNNNETRPQIVYQFLYNNNSRQQTEACEDLHCPWCSLDCGSLYPLLKHLRLCHARFSFTYVPLQNGGARIDVAINELYDSSYAGTPHSLAGPRLPSAGPTRRAPVTRLLVNRSRKCQNNVNSLTEFLQQREECERDARRPYLAGHARLYHHTGTCLPVWPQELDCDSEGEHDPDWLRTKTTMMIDDFTDVNEGEKELMKLWNLHVMKFGFVGDCQIPLACIEFVKHRGKEILMRNLYKNFVLHMCSLFDFGLISPVTLYGVVRKLQALEGAPEGAELARINTAVEQQVALAAVHRNGHTGGHRRKLNLTNGQKVI